MRRPRRLRPRFESMETKALTAVLVAPLPGVVAHVAPLPPLQLYGASRGVWIRYPVNAANPVPTFIAFATGPDLIIHRGTGPMQFGFSGQIDDANRAMNLVGGIRLQGGLGSSMDLGVVSGSNRPVITNGPKGSIQIQIKFQWVVLTTSVDYRNYVGRKGVGVLTLYGHGSPGVPGHPIPPSQFDLTLS